MITQISKKSGLNVMNKGVALVDQTNDEGKSYFVLSGEDKKLWPLKLHIHKNPLAIGIAVKVCAKPI